MATSDRNGSLLSDRQMQEFIRNGFVSVHTALPAEFHTSICRRTEQLLGAEPNPGNNLLPRIPELAKMLADPAVRGALTSILGPRYLLDDHRFCHANQPGSAAQTMHQDGGSQGDHRTRKVLLLYYPQDTPERLGPTGVLPGSQYYAQRLDDVELLPVTGSAGMVTITHYELWHAATANRAPRPRYMMKFLLHRMQEPQAPSWNAIDPHWDTESALWQTMWRWHRGDRAADAAAAGNGTSRAKGDVDLRGLSDPQVRRGMEAAYTLAGAAANGGGTALIAQLCGALASDSPTTATRASYALAAAGAVAVPALSAALVHANPQVRGYAARALAEMGAVAGQAEAELRAALHDRDAQVRNWGGTALGTGHSSDPAASIAALESALETDLPDTKYRRQIAAHSIARLAAHVEGDAAADVTRLLAPHLDSNNRYVRGLAAEALRRLDTPAATELLLEWLSVARWCPITTPDSPF